MTHPTNEEPAAIGQPRHSLRVTLVWDGAALRVARVARVAMRAPGSAGPPPVEGQVGFWIELRDRDDRVRYHRVMHSPIRTHVEIFSPTRIEAHPITPQPTEFDVIVPDLDDARDLVVWSSPVEHARAMELARVLGRFNLRSDDRPGEQRK